MKSLITIEPIAVKDKHDVVKALTILEKLGIEIMTKEKKDDYLKDETREVDNDFMIQKDGGDGFRIQSHYLGDGISIESLEKQVNDVIENDSNVYNKVMELERKRKELIKEVEKSKELIKEVENSNISIHLKED